MQLKMISAADAAAGTQLGADLAQAIAEARDAQQVDDEYSAALAVWIDLTARLTLGGVPWQLLQNQVFTVAMRATCEGNA